VWEARLAPKARWLRLAGIALALFLAAAPAFAEFPPAEGKALCGGVVSVPGSTNSVLLDAAADFARCLEKATGRKFSVTNAVAPLGFVLGVASNPELAGAPGLERLAKMGKEAFLVHSDGNGRVWIAGSTPQGAQHGAYAFLGKLGFRWYLPGDAWEVVPPLKSVSGKVELCDAPVFRARGFFGTGAFGGKLPIDPEMKLSRRWDLWKRRNLLGGEYQIGGHSYESFNLQNKAEMTAHPEYRPEIGGQRVEFNQGMKLCYATPGLQALFTSNRLAVLRATVQQDPDAPRAFAVSVEPSDGGGHCECAGCRKLGSVSDRVFTLANVVARAVAKEFPGRCVNILAYNEHAAVPSIDIEPNVFVKIVPYGFQRTGLSPEEFITAWAAKVKRLGVYDYWAIPDWAHCLPLPPTRYLDRVRFWHEKGVESFLGESVYSAGSAGYAWFLTARRLWNPATDLGPVSDDFFNGSFGKAAPPVRRMFARWDVPENYFPLTEQELALAFRDLAEANQLAGDDEAIRGRLDDLKRYVVYLQLWHEFQLAAHGTPERVERARKLVLHGYRVYDSAMVHSFRMSQLIINRYVSAKEPNAELQKEWFGKDAKGWATVTPLGREELDRLVAEGVAKYKPVDIESRAFSSDLVPLSPKLPVGAPDPARGWFFMGTHEFALWLPEGQKEAKLRILFRDWDRKVRPDHLIVTDAAGKVVVDKECPGDNEEREYALALPSPGHYRLKVADLKLGYRLRPPAALHFAILGNATSGDLCPRTWFFVPKGLKRIAIRTDAGAHLKLFDADGKPVPLAGERLLWADVPAGQDGRPWSFSGFKSSTPLRMLNCPQAFSLTPDTLLVPKECRP
jgi:hypothetical protein